jgi:hypothetical protein
MRKTSTRSAVDGDPGAVAAQTGPHRTLLLIHNQSTGRLTLATRMPSMTDPSEFALEQLREGADFTVYRGRQRGNPTPVLVVAPAAERPSPQSLRRLEHEYLLAAERPPLHSVFDTCPFPICYLGFFQITSE